MESDKKDIRHFDLLEKSEVDGDMDLVAIKKMDGAVSGIVMESTSPDFTSRVVRSAIMLAKRQANLKFLYWLIGIFSIVSVLLFFIIPSGSAFVLPEYIPTFFDQMGKYIAIFTDPKFKQFFLIAEGIVCLVIVEKIVSRHKFFRHLAH